MTRPSFVRAAAVFGATAALIALTALPASAVEPGDGAVIYNPDGTPIGSELVYGASDTPQYGYTTNTNDDDFWGFDTATGEPDHDQGGNPDAGIPLGFSVFLGGVTYDQVVVNSNGALCFTSSTDATVSVSASPSFRCWWYEQPAAILANAETHNDGQSFGGLLVMNTDQYPADDEPVDSDSDTVNDSCLRGGFYFADLDVCSSVFWGTTTYEGKTAFVATWYLNPDIGQQDSASTYQALVVDDGSGNVTVVYNYDQVQGEGYELDWEWNDDIAESVACQAAEEAGDDRTYLSVGVASSLTGTPEASIALDFYGPECMHGLNPTTVDDLVDGGASSLVTGSLNSAVAGRYVFRIVSGIPTLEPVGVAATPTLPNTGVSIEQTIVGSGVLLLVGAGFLIAATRRREREAGYSQSCD